MLFPRSYILTPPVPAQVVSWALKRRFPWAGRHFPWAGVTFPGLGVEAPLPLCFWLLFLMIRMFLDRLSCLPPHHLPGNCPLPHSFTDGLPAAVVHP